jgi:hypothetical protein
MPNVDFQAAAKQEEDYLRAVHPATTDIPGCMNLFDKYLSCNGPSLPPGILSSHLSPFSVVASQVKSLYRYGHMTVCGQKLDDFKFCISRKSLHPEERREAWIRRRAEWWANRRITKSSEDVWEMRT